MHPFAMIVSGNLCARQLNLIYTLHCENENAVRKISSEKSGDSVEIGNRTSMTLVLKDNISPFYKTPGIFCTCQPTTRYHIFLMIFQIYRNQSGVCSILFKKAPKFQNFIAFAICYYQDSVWSSFH